VVLKPELIDAAEEAILSIMPISFPN